MFGCMFCRSVSPQAVMDQSMALSDEDQLAGDESQSEPVIDRHSKRTRINTEMSPKSVASSNDDEPTTQEAALTAACAVDPVSAPPKPRVERTEQQTSLLCSIKFLSTHRKVRADPEVQCVYDPVFKYLDQFAAEKESASGSGGGACVPSVVDLDAPAEPPYPLFSFKENVQTLSSLMSRTTDELRALVNGHTTPAAYPEPKGVSLHFPPPAPPVPLPLPLTTTKAPKRLPPPPPPLPPDWKLSGAADDAETALPIKAGRPRIRKSPAPDAGGAAALQPRSIASAAANRKSQPAPKQVERVVYGRGTVPYNWINEQKQHATDKPPTNFTPIAENRFHPSTSAYANQRDALFGCDCRPRVQSKSTTLRPACRNRCSCGAAGTRYEERGGVVMITHLQRGQNHIFECNSKCKCDGMRIVLC